VGIKKLFKYIGIWLWLEEEIYFMSDPVIINRDLLFIIKLGISIRKIIKRSKNGS